MKVVNFLDVTLNLADGTYRPYRKPNDTPVYVHSQSNHPPTIIKQIPKAISRRLTDISSNQDAFREAAPLYNSALRNSGYAEGLEYLEERDKDSSKKKKKQAAEYHLVQPAIQQDSGHKHRTEILATNRNTLPRRIQTTQDLQPEYS